MIYEYLKYYKGIIFSSSCSGVRLKDLSTTFNTHKIGLKKKKNHLVKKIKSTYKGLKITKTHIWQKLKNEIFTKKKIYIYIFLLKSFIF